MLVSALNDVSYVPSHKIIVMPSFLKHHLHSPFAPDFQCDIGEFNRMQQILGEISPENRVGGIAGFSRIWSGSKSSVYLPKLADSLVPNSLVHLVKLVCGLRIVQENLGISEHWNRVEGFVGTALIHRGILRDYPFNPNISGSCPCKVRSEIHLLALGIDHLLAGCENRGGETVVPVLELLGH